MRIIWPETHVYEICSSHRPWNCPQVRSPLWHDKLYWVQSPGGHALCNRSDVMRAETELSFQTLLPLTSFFASGSAHTDGWVSHCDLIRLAWLIHAGIAEGEVRSHHDKRTKATLKRQQRAWLQLNLILQYAGGRSIPASWVIMFLTWNWICSTENIPDLSIWNVWQDKEKK